MKTVDTDKINILIFNYLSLVGLSKNEELDLDNPVSNYFYNKIYTPNIDPINKYNHLLISTTDTKTKISYDVFYEILKETYRLYKKIDIIKEDKDIAYTEMISQIINDNIDFYINRIISQYKDSLYSILLETKSSRLNYMKIDVFTDKMMYYSSIERYEDAHKLQCVINKLKSQK